MNLVVDPMGAGHGVELGWTHAVQSLGDLGWLMRGLSALGPSPLMWALILALFFGVSPRLGARVLVYVLIAAWVREVLALVLQSPRPYWLDPGVRTFGDVATQRATYGFPSGHALIGTAFWLFLAAEFRRAWGWVVAVAVVLLIATSRVFLGVHFVSDVVFGTLAGAIFCWAYRQFEGRGESFMAGLSPRSGRVLALGLGLAMLGTGLLARAWAEQTPVPEAFLKFGLQARKANIFALLGGSLAGVGVGLLSLDPRAWASISAPASGWLRATRIGVAGAVGYGVSKLVELPIVRPGSQTSDGPVRWLASFLGATLLVAAVWWGLPRCLRIGAKDPAEHVG